MTTAPHNGYDTTPEHVLFMVFALRERNGLPCKFDFSCVVVLPGVVFQIDTLVVPPFMASRKNTRNFWR